MKKLILSALLAFASLNTPLLAQTFEIEGHRGSRGLMPENTIEAFKKELSAFFEEVPQMILTSAENQLGKDDVLGLIHHINENFVVPEDYKVFE